MNLWHALRLPPLPLLAMSGAGGKTTALFHLARCLSAHLPCVVTTTTHLGAWQASQADFHLVLSPGKERIIQETDFPPGVTLVSGPPDSTDRLQAIPEDVLYLLYEKWQKQKIALLIEADGARQKPLKAPAPHEPVIPDFVQAVLVVAGLSALGQPLDEDHVHRPEIFSRLSHLPMGAPISPEAITRFLIHPEGGQKGIPETARRLLLLNQADTPTLQAAGGKIAKSVLSVYDTVAVGTLQPVQFQTFEPVAGIILAAGESKRFGAPKQLLEWHGKPFIRHVAEAALAANLTPVVVVTGANAAEVSAAVQDLPITLCHNPAWPSGQSSSLQCGLQALPSKTGAAIFLLADQPQVTSTVLRALVERHSVDLSPIVAPQVQGQRANPVLFDRETFPALISLAGDVGGRAIFSRFPVTYLSWHDTSLLVDVDTPGDVEKLP